MKKSDEFRIARMLEELPAQKAGAEMDAKFEKLKGHYPSEKPMASRFRWISYSVAASISMFLVGYLVATQTHKANLEKVASLNEEIRASLVQSFSDGDSPNKQIAAIKVLSKSTQENAYVDELIKIYQSIENDNVKLAIIQELSQSSSKANVNEFLLKQLEKEDSPLIVIPIINLLSKAGAEEGKQILKKLLESKEDAHPAVINYLKSIKL